MVTPLMPDASSIEVRSPDSLSRFAWPVTLAFCGLVVGLWAFPSLWFTRSQPNEARLWFREQTSVSGWDYHEAPVAETAERILVADRIVNGAFTNAQGSMVRVFSAKRYSEKPDEIGLFMHTPDRCWTDAGGQIEVVSPDHLELTVHGVRMGFERRLFRFQGQPELVYFGALVGGRPVPYRLDHNLSVGLKRALRQKAGSAESAVRVLDTYFWRRAWDGFVERVPLLGPKQFVRISTPVRGEEIANADQRLASFLGDWLSLADYPAELSEWEGHRR